jgi:hypothetical protein
MKTLIALCAAVALTGCSTMMNDRMQDVSILGAPGTAYSITNQNGQRVAQGVAPATVKLDAARGFFDGETYQVNGKELDSQVTPWYWVGFCITVFSGLLVDPLTGDMFALPDEVQL